MKKKKIIITLVCLVVVFSVAVVIVFLQKNRITDVNYKDFRNFVEEKSISKVILENDKILFNKKDDTTTYRTENPKTEDFKEYLLLNDIKVENASNPLIVLDILFYGIFFGAVRIWNLSNY